MDFGFEFLERVYHHLDQPSEREFARRLGTYLQRLQSWRRSNKSIKEAFQILCRARALSGETWNQFGKKLDDELK